MLVALSTCAAVTGRWIADTFVDPVGWSDTMGELLDDDEVADEVAAIVTERAVEAVVAQVLDIPLLPGGVEDRIESTVRDRVSPAVERVLRTEAASTVWRTAVERSHDTVVALIRDDETTLVGDRTIRLDLSPLADRIVESVIDGLAGVLEFGGIDIAVEPDLGLDLTIALYDLGDHDLALDLAGAAEERRTLWTVVAASSVAVSVLGRRHRARWLAGSGAAVVGAAGTFAAAVRAAEPEGLVATWGHVADTATPYAAAAAGIGAVLLATGALLPFLPRLRSV